MEDLVLNLKDVHGGETLTLEFNLEIFEFDSLPFLFKKELIHRYSL